MKEGIEGGINRGIDARVDRGAILAEEQKNKNSGVILWLSHNLLVSLAPLS
jgi:hypothetical protein